MARSLVGPVLPMRPAMRYRLSCGHSVILPEQTFTALADPDNWQFCERCQDARKFARRKAHTSPLQKLGG